MAAHGFAVIANGRGVAEAKSRGRAFITVIIIVIVMHGYGAKERGIVVKFGVFLVIANRHERARFPRRSRPLREETRRDRRIIAFFCHRKRAYDVACGTGRLSAIRKNAFPEEIFDRGSKIRGQNQSGNSVRDAVRDRGTPRFPIRPV